LGLTRRKFSGFDSIHPILGSDLSSLPTTPGHTDIENHVLGSQTGERGLESDSLQSARPKKRASGKISRKDKRIQFPDLVEPLSEWAKNNGIQPKDVHAFATRDINKRVAQAARSGYVKRNLNVFFLYKRAYGTVAQAWMKIHHPSLAQTQPPLVTLVGESWAKESAEFKRSYTIYSDLEKEGLRNAFPHYKYKPGAKKGHIGATTSTKESHSHTKHGSSTAHLDRGRQARSDTPMGTNRARGSELERADDLPMDLGAESLLAPHELHQAPGSWSGSSEPVQMMGTYSNSFLHPGRAEWHTPVRGGTRSPSPAGSHRSQPQMDAMPIDPSLPATYTDYYSSRAASEEPGYIVPSQAFTPAASDIVCSRAMSSDPMFDGTDGLPDTNSVWKPQYTAFRSVSEETWLGAPDSILSSVPLDNRAAHHTLSSEGHDWHLEAIEQDETLQPFTWGLNDWTVDLEDGSFSDIH
jgi:hypothetical protein